MKKSRILVVDDHALLRHGLKSIIQYQKDMEVVGEAENGKVAAQQAKSLLPDLVVMDLVMPVMDGVEATRLIKAASQQTKILILTTFGTSADISRALDAGASGAVMKDTPDDKLLSAMRRIAKGETVLSPDIEHMLRNEPEPPKLTERQLDILDALARGFTNRDIALQLGLKPSGVRVHIDAILSKLNAATRTEAVAIAIKRHLLKPQTSD
ncbi:MAG: response regulator transcription factor [Kiritimatiellae bacterium]|nr:response regulator transcription factor [Kiritimatiellia bacterium]MBQ6329354.1 response regulator transcription factor [Kiritimatiellia bacterium]